MIRFQNIRVSAYSDTLFRVEYQPQGQFEDLPTLMMGKMPGEIEVKSEAVENRLVVRTGKCEFLYQRLGNDFHKDRLEVRFRHGDEMRMWDRSTGHTVPAPEVYRSLDEWAQGFKKHPHPILINADGWHSMEESSGVYWDDESRWPVVKRRPYYQNLYLFFYGNDTEQAFRDFVHIFGKPPLLPRQALGAWYSRWYNYQAHELMELAATYRKHGVPLDVLVIDVDWHKQHWNGYDWRKESFPDPAQFIGAIKGKGLALMLNDHPGYDLADPLPEDDSRLPALRHAIGEPPYKGLWACDWSRASVVGQWARHCLGDLLQQGIDWWWIDGWGDVPFPGVDPQLWLNWQYYEITKKARPGKRALILSRWGGPGSHRYPVQFSGDTHSNFETLKFEVDYTAYSGGLGAYYWSHDIGGFHEPEIDEEVYVRWVQFGALSPIFRTHSNHGTREPFNFSPRALAVYRNYLSLRYRLVPYLEQLVMRCHATGFPIVYPMDFVFPGKESSGQYFLGKSIVVAPVTSAIPGAADRESIWDRDVDKNLCLPEGEWLDALSGNWIPGGKICKRVKLEHIPFFIAKGAIIATMPVTSPIPKGVYPEITFNIFGCDRDCEEVFYFDDGETDHQMDAEHTSRLSVRCRRNKGQFTVECETGSQREFLPHSVSFICYGADAAALYHDGKICDFDRNPPTFLDAFAQTPPPCVRWSIPKDRPRANCQWTLEFAPPAERRPN